MDLGEHRIRRDSDGEVLPETVFVGDYGQAKIRPMSVGKAEEIFGESGRVAGMDYDDIAELFRTHVVEPDFDQHVKQSPELEAEELTGDILEEEFKAGLPTAMMSKIQEVSGFGGAVAETEEGVEVSFR